ncbi:hypothetical protein [Variovorax sp. GT1P44]|uniref:hypothetical protein n=1 Tax=Variovorax sp. GT1P44 TaxID=3443742 RepID=UPI003F476386
MNCKPGDLAIMTVSVGGNEGKIVRCLHLRAPAQVMVPGGEIKDFGPLWVIDRELTTWQGGKSRCVADQFLRPIRDPGDDARDETLAWKPVPLPEILPSLLPIKEEA